MWLRLLALSAALALGACTDLPSLDGRSVSHALDDEAADATPLGRHLAPQLDAHPEMSGVRLLGDPLDAFVARMALAKRATETLDLQYYIWHRDITGLLLYEAVLDAADRGVRVRLLIDDFNTAELDPTLAALDAHERIEVRLFNPFVHREHRWRSYLTDFRRINRRMHNKSFTVDARVSILGGRNVGDEYFGATEDVAFSDLDMLAVGPVVDAIATDFDAYWSSESAYPAASVVEGAEGYDGDALRADAAGRRSSALGRSYRERLADSALARELRDGAPEFDWAPAIIVSDDPVKALGRIEEADLLISRLRAIVGEPAERLQVISAYFLPTDEVVEELTTLAADGVDVTVVTNSLESTDSPVVYGGYAGQRRPLLEAGMAVHEIRSENAAPEVDERAGPFGSTSASLHAKTMTVDDRQLFVGSFNFDPRSTRLNTELGILVDSESLTSRTAAMFAERLAETTYELALSAEGDTLWIDRRGGEEVVHETAPGTGRWTRTIVYLTSLLPIDWML